MRLNSAFFLPVPVSVCVCLKAEVRKISRHLLFCSTSGSVAEFELGWMLFGAHESIDTFSSAGPQVFFLSELDYRRWETDEALQETRPQRAANQRLHVSASWLHHLSQNYAAEKGKITVSGNMSP